MRAAVLPVLYVPIPPSNQPDVVHLQLGKEIKGAEVRAAATFCGKSPNRCTCVKGMQAVEIFWGQVGQGVSGHLVRVISKWEVK